MRALLNPEGKKLTDTKTARALTLALCSASLLTACGGGGGGDPADAVDRAAQTAAAAADAFGRREFATCDRLTQEAETIDLP